MTQVPKSRFLVLYHQTRIHMRFDPNVEIASDLEAPVICTMPIKKMDVITMSYNPSPAVSGPVSLIYLSSIPSPPPFRLSRLEINFGVSSRQAHPAPSFVERIWWFCSHLSFVVQNWLCYKMLTKL